MRLLGRILSANSVRKRASEPAPRQNRCKVLLHMPLPQDTQHAVKLRGGKCPVALSAKHGATSYPRPFGHLLDVSDLTA